MTGEDHGKAGKTRMKQRLWSIFNNESALGRAMNVCGIVIAANIMFVLVSMFMHTGIRIRMSVCI